MGKGLQLPGAERFSHYLEENLNGTLSIEGPELVNTLRKDEFIKKWIIKLDGRNIGEYLIYGHTLGEREYSLEFMGRIPGYTNKSVVFDNTLRKKSKRRPEDSVYLIYTWADSEDTMFQRTEKIPCRPWKRRDGHKSIPFP